MVKVVVGVLTRIYHKWCEMGEMMVMEMEMVMVVQIVALLLRELG